MEEAQTGTLEQVFLTPYGPIPLFLVRNVAGLLAQGLLVLLVALTLMALTGARLAFTPGGSCPFWSWSWGGTAWASPWPPWPSSSSGWGRFWGSPSSCSSSSCSAGERGVPLPAPGPGGGPGPQDAGGGGSPGSWSLGLAFLNSLAYLLLGLWLFRMAVGRAKRLGLLHGY